MGLLHICQDIAQNNCMGVCSRVHTHIHPRWHTHTQVTISSKGKAAGLSVFWCTESSDSPKVEAVFSLLVGSEPFSRVQDVE